MRQALTGRAGRGCGHAQPRHAGQQRRCVQSAVRSSSGTGRTRMACLAVASVAEERGECWQGCRGAWGRPNPRPSRRSCCTRLPAAGAGSGTLDLGLQSNWLRRCARAGRSSPRPLLALRARHSLSPPRIRHPSPRMTHASRPEAAPALTGPAASHSLSHPALAGALPAVLSARAQVPSARPSAFADTPSRPRPPARPLRPVPVIPHAAAAR